MNVTVYVISNDEHDLTMRDCRRVFVSTEEIASQGHVRRVTFERRDGSPFVPAVVITRVYGAIEIVCGE